MLFSFLDSIVDFTFVSGAVSGVVEAMCWFYNRVALMCA